jgi:hypothetical protein
MNTAVLSSAVPMAASTANVVGITQPRRHGSQEILTPLKRQMAGDTLHQPLLHIGQGESTLHAKSLRRRASSRAL